MTFLMYVLTLTMIQETIKTENVSLGYGSPQIDEDTGEENTDSMTYLDINKKMLILTIYVTGTIIVFFYFYCYYVINQYSIGKGDEDDIELPSDSDDD